MNRPAETIGYDDFVKIDVRVGQIVEAEAFPEARKPAYKLKVDFGSGVGVLKSAAQITDLYELEDLVGKKVVGVVNFPRKQIGKFMSECLITGFEKEDGAIVLTVPDKDAPVGAKLC